LAALRYRIATLDKHKLGRRQGVAAVGTPTKTPEQLALEAAARRFGEMMESDDPRIWGPLG
jgi:hypothetical protein